MASLLLSGFSSSLMAQKKTPAASPEKVAEKKEDKKVDPKDPEYPTAKCALEFSSEKETIGTIIVGVFGNAVPKTANNFMVLCAGNKFKDPNTHKVVTPDKKFEKPLYVGSTVHRVIPGFMIQAGDFQNNDGTGGFSVYGPKFDDENFTLKHDPVAGTLSMANAGANTNGSQFFITVAPTDWLNGKHVVFGKILNDVKIKGDKVDSSATAKKIEALGSASGATKTKIVISKSYEVK